MGHRPSIGVHDDLPARKPRVRVGPAQDEAARGVDEVLRLPVLQVLRGDGLAHHLPDQVLPQLLLLHLGGVLGGDHHGLDVKGLVPLVDHGDLGLAVGPEVGQKPRLPHLGEAHGEAVGQGDGEGHELGGLVGGVTEHEPLVPGPHPVQGVGGLEDPPLVGEVDPAGDVGGLLVYGGEDGAGVGVKAVLGPGVPHLPHRLAHQVGDVHVPLGGDLPGHEDEPGGHQGLRRHPGLLVLGDEGVQDGVGDPVGQLIRVPLGNRFRRDQPQRAHLLYPDAPFGATLIV